MEKDIKGYEGLYSIDTSGRVWSYRSNRYLKEQTFAGKKYKYYNLYKDGTGKKCRTHRLVAEAFIPNPDNLPEVNHKDENPENNNVENLEWCNRNYNMNYGIRNSVVSQKMKGNKNQAHYPIQQFSLDGLFLKEFSDAVEASKEVKVDSSNILRACYRNGVCAGYKWKQVKTLLEVGE